MSEVVPIPVVDLILDPANARLGEQQASQQAVYKALAEQQGARLVELASDIVESGLDPTALPAVVATADRRRKYKVIEGNRRILAVKALENPSIVAIGLAPRDHAKLTVLARRYSENPIENISCVLFDTEEEAYHWVELRHTGSNDGAGLVEWNSNEQDRFKARHGKGGQRRPAGQIIDFLVQVDGPLTGETKVMTTIQRIINTKEVREALGIEVKGGAVVSHYPSAEVLKGLRRMVGDLTSQSIKVKDVYYEDDRRDYIATFGKEDLPDRGTKLSAPRPLSELDAPSRTELKPRKKVARKTKSPATRTSVVPSACTINPTPPRINNIFNELTGLDADTFPNAGAVLLRVFLELSVDHVITTNSLLTEQQRNSDSLSKRLKTVAAWMKSNGRIESQLEAAIIKVADSRHTLAASTVTFNQYVHNKFVFPKPSEVRTAWDELQPFLEKVWE